MREIASEGFTLSSFQQKDVRINEWVEIVLRCASDSWDNKLSDEKTSLVLKYFRDTIIPRIPREQSENIYSQMKSKKGFSNTAASQTSLLREWVGLATAAPAKGLPKEPMPRANLPKRSVPSEPQKPIAPRRPSKGLKEVSIQPPRLQPKAQGGPRATGTPVQTPLQKAPARDQKTAHEILQPAPRALQPHVDKFIQDIKKSLQGTLSEAQLTRLTSTLQENIPETTRDDTTGKALIEMRALNILYGEISFHDQGVDLKNRGKVSRSSEVAQKILFSNIRKYVEEGGDRAALSESQNDPFVQLWFQLPSTDKAEEILPLQGSRPLELLKEEEIEFFLKEEKSLQEELLDTSLLLPLEFKDLISKLHDNFPRGLRDSEKARALIRVRALNLLGYSVDFSTAKFTSTGRHRMETAAQSLLQSVQGYLRDHKKEQPDFEFYQAELALSSERLKVPESNPVIGQEEPEAVPRKPSLPSEESRKISEEMSPKSSPAARDFLIQICTTSFKQIKQKPKLPLNEWLWIIQEAIHYSTQVKKLEFDATSVLTYVKTDIIPKIKPPTKKQEFLNVLKKIPELNDPKNSSLCAALGLPPPPKPKH
jgi:hypothetical protein